MAAHGRFRRRGLAQRAGGARQLVGAAAQVAYQGPGRLGQGPGFVGGAAHLRGGGRHLGRGLAHAAQGRCSGLHQRLHLTDGPARLAQGVFHRARQRSGVSLQGPGQLLHGLCGVGRAAQRLAGPGRGQQLAGGRRHGREVAPDLAQVQTFELRLQCLQPGGGGGDQGQAVCHGEGGVASQGAVPSGEVQIHIEQPREQALGGQAGDQAALDQGRQRCTMTAGVGLGRGALGRWPPRGNGKRGLQQWPQQFAVELGRHR